MNWPNPITGRAADTVQAAIADGIPVPARPGQALQALGVATNQRPPAVASTVTADRNDHAAAAAYLMRHHGASALLILDGTRSDRPGGILTEADLIQAQADGRDLNQVRVQALMSQNDPARSAPDAAGSRAGSPAGG